MAAVKIRQFKILIHADCAKRTSFYAEAALRTSVQTVNVFAEHFFACDIFRREHVNASVRAALFAHTASGAAIFAIFIFDHLLSPAETRIHFQGRFVFRILFRHNSFRLKEILHRDREAFQKAERLNDAFKILLH